MHAYSMQYPSGACCGWLHGLGSGGDPGAESEVALVVKVAIRLLGPQGSILGPQPAVGAVGACVAQTEVLQRC